MPIGLRRDPEAPRAIGPYSQAHPRQRASSSPPARWASIPPPASWWTAASRSRPSACSQNIRAILEAERLRLVQVVKTTVFLVDMADFAAMNEVYARAFGDHRPARSTVAVAALPRGARGRDRRRGGVTFLTLGADRAWWSGRSSKPRRRRLRRLRWVRFPHAPATSSRHPLRDAPDMTLRVARSLGGLLVLVAASVGHAGSRAAAQDSAAVSAPAGRGTVADSLALHTSPMNAFWRSFLLPGWGQATLGPEAHGRDLHRLGRRSPSA